MSLPPPREPLLFHRLAKAAVWGGTTLAERLGVDLPDGHPMGESWELSDVPGSETSIRGGTFDGLSLQQLLAAHPNELLGQSRLDPTGRFPLLVKWIDATDDLSVQIHPPDGPLSPTGIGKTEAWYILAYSSPDASIIAGLQKGTTAEDLQADASGPKVLNHLRSVTVTGGDTYLIPAGTVHAIRAGTLLCEVQQTSDVTYRMYDWGRLGLDGQPRETHLAQALEVVDFAAPAPLASRADFASTELAVQTGLLAECPYFRLHLVRLHQSADHDPKGYARTLTVVAGSGSMHSAQGGARNLRFGDTVLLPAQMGKFEVTPGPQGLDLLEAVAL
jgi:mannose-6-phosphate isomerase